MKSFNEFINEGHQFLRSIGKNDSVVAQKTFSDLRENDWFYCVSTSNGDIRHCRIHYIRKDGDDILLYVGGSYDRVDKQYVNSTVAVDGITTKFIISTDLDDLKAAADEYGVEISDNIIKFY